MAINEQRSGRDVVLITGISGAIGMALYEALWMKFDILGLDQRCDPAVNDCVAVNITSDENVQAALTHVRQQYGNRIASVIHLAAYFDLSGAPDRRYEDVNILGTRRLLHALQSFEVEQFVYASTMLVHAPTRPGLPINEDSPLAAKWAYPESKLKTEAVVSKEHGRIPYVLLRIAGVYTDRCGSPFLANQMQRIYERRLTASFYAADPSTGQSFIHIDDLATALSSLVQRRKQLPNALSLLLGEPTVMSYAALQNRLAYLLLGEQQWQTLEIPKSLAKTGAWLQHKTEPLIPDALDQGEQPFIQPYMVDLAEDHYEIDISRARQTLDFEPQHKLQDTLPRMVEALQEDPAEWYREHKLTLPGWMQDAEDAKLNAHRLISDHEAQMEDNHRRTRWAHFINIGLGTWLLTSPPILGYTDPRMIANDMLCGLLVILFGAMSLSWRKGWAKVANATIACWLLFAPLVFWTQNAAAYTNDTLLAALIFAFAILVPPMPGVSPVANMAGPDTPPGWDYNPSAWVQRIPIIGLAFIGLYFSRYLAAFQLGHIGSAWDPFFGAGTERIITSDISKAWPVSDAGLGAVTYMLEILTGMLGDRRRWRTLPWAVIVFGIMIVPLGAVSIYFIIIQPVLIGTWCTLCLVGAVAMVAQIPYSFDEILATCQFLRQRRREGKPLLRVFLQGDTIDGGRPGPDDEFAAPTKAVLKDMVAGGVNLPWTLLVSIGIGVWLMFTRLSLGTAGDLANSDHVLGALIITFAVTATAEVARPLRFVNVLFGALLMLTPGIFAGSAGTAGVWNSVIAGALLIAVSIPRGPVRCSYGPWNKLIV